MFVCLFDCLFVCLFSFLLAFFVCHLLFVLLLLVGRCLLRLGQRAEGLGILERAEKETLDNATTPTTVTSCDQLWPTLKPVRVWATQEISRLLFAHRAAESSHTAAVDAYARGAFGDAVILFTRSLTILQLGSSGDDDSLSNNTYYRSITMAIIKPIAIHQSSIILLYLFLTNRHLPL